MKTILSKEASVWKLVNQIRKSWKRNRTRTVPEKAPRSDHSASEELKNHRVNERSQDSNIRTQPIEPINQSSLNGSLGLSAALAFIRSPVCVSAGPAQI